MRQLNYPIELEEVLVCRFGVVASLTLISVAVVAPGCRRKEPPAPPVAAPSVTLNHDRVPLGSPLDITYKFVVANDTTFDQDYRVFVHVLDADEELMWTDDHDPPVPTTQWKPGQKVEYTRTVFVPVYPYVGEASIQVGLHSRSSKKRLPLSGEDAGQRAYKVARFLSAPQTDNLPINFKDGWHAAEVAEHNASVEWYWTKREATLRFKNPKKDSLFYLVLDNPGGAFADRQQVTISLNGDPLDQIAITPGAGETMRKIALPAAKLGTGDVAELRVTVDKTFVPSQLSPSSKDSRELGVRVFHAFVDPIR
jgi:hypothetical protein